MRSISKWKKIMAIDTYTTLPHQFIATYLQISQTLQWLRENHEFYYATPTFVFYFSFFFSPISCSELARRASRDQPCMNAIGCRQEGRRNNDQQGQGQGHSTAERQGCQMNELKLSYFYLRALILKVIINKVSGSSSLSFMALWIVFRIFWRICLEA